MTKNKLSRELEEKIKLVFYDQPASIRLICLALNIGPITLFDRMKMLNLTFPKDIIPYRCNPEIDECIDQGLTLEQMSESHGKSKEYYRQYINATGQYDQFRKNRHDAIHLPLRKKRAIKNLINILHKHVIKRRIEINWAMGKALEYRHHNNSRSINLDILFSIFDKYDKAIKEGKKLSLNELGEGSHIYPANVGRILKNAGLQPMYGTLERKATSKKEKIMIKRSFRLPLNSIDISYFIGTKKHNVHDKFRMMGGRKNQQSKFLSKRITYRLASQVYEAQDIHMDNEDICDLLEINEELLAYITLKRDSYEPRIIKALRVIYADKNLNKPYKLTSADTNNN